MPEFGMMFKFDADYDHLSWYGLGPDDTYTDRKRGAKLGIHAVNVQDNLAKYLIPHELENARHAFELPLVHNTVIRVAQQQLGIAGDDSWSARTHDEYLLDISGPKSFKFSFRGI